MNDAFLPACLQRGELDRGRREAFAGELLTLLAERTERYTMGDSTSVREETAERLLRGISYCIDLHLRTDGGGNAGAQPVRALYEAGVKDAQRQARHAKLLLKQAEANRPPVENVGFADTLSSLPAFFKRYDAVFFAHEIPCGIDYPLCHAVSEELLGAEYVAEYLRRWNMECAFLRRFSAPLLSLLYERSIGDAGLLVNLYSPAAEAALGRALSGKAVLNLFADKEDHKCICERVGRAPEDAARAALCAAAERVCAELDITGGAEQAYLQNTALALLPRLRACAPEAGYEAIFPLRPAVF